MTRLTQFNSLRITLSLLLATGIGLARTEKIWAQNLDGLDTAPTSVSMPAPEGHEPFDPRRVPQTGGGASRLLAGLNVKHA